MLAALAPVAARAQTQTQTKTLSLTFDDGLDPEAFPAAPAWNRQLLDALRDGGVRAMVFPTLRNTPTAEGKRLIADWSAAGHGVGNHTAHHQSLSSARTTLAGFVADIEEDERAFGTLPTWEPRLRFPYLKEGDTAEKRDGVRQWMQTHGYRPAPVSIDTSDWYYNRGYLDWLKQGDTARAEAVQQRYVAHLLDRAAYYDALAVDVLHRHPAHVMLLHVNALNAAAVGPVVAAFRARGWRFVPPEEAFDDPLYARPPEPDLLPAGESAVWARAKAAGVAGLRYPGEDAVYEEPRLREAGLLPPPTPPPSTP